MRKDASDARVYCLTTKRSFTGFKRVIYCCDARSDMRVFIAKYWFKDRDKG